MDITLPAPMRKRQCPSQFSWVDQRLARHRYFERASTSAWALYLFLLTVADPQGASYYSERSMGLRLQLKPEQLAGARRELIDLDLIAYRAPIYQVLALADVVSKQRTTPQRARQHLQAMRRALK